MIIGTSRDPRRVPTRRTLAVAFAVPPAPSPGLVLVGGKRRVPRPWRAPRTKRPSCHTPSSSRRIRPRPRGRPSISRSPSYTLGFEGRPRREGGVGPWPPVPTERLEVDADVARPPPDLHLWPPGFRPPTSAVGCHLFVGARHASVYQPRSPRSTRRRGRFPLVDQKLRKHGSGRRPRPQQAHGAAETREGVPHLETRSGVSRGGAFAGPARVLQRAVG